MLEQQLTNAPVPVAGRRQQTSPTGLVLRVDVDLVKLEQLFDVVHHAVKARLMQQRLLVRVNVLERASSFGRSSATSHAWRCGVVICARRN